MPEISYKFPSKSYPDKRRPNGYMQRSCLIKWLENFAFLYYSKPEDGLYCLACVLFPMPAHHGKIAIYLIKAPYQNWKKAVDDMKQHAILQYHKDSMVKMKHFMETSKNLCLRIDVQTHGLGKETIKKE